jgi:hypothetical protein
LRADLRVEHSRVPVKNGSPPETLSHAEQLGVAGAFGVRNEALERAVGLGHPPKLAIEAAEQEL